MTYEKQEIQVNESIKVVFKTHVDYDYEPDFMGTFGREPKEWCIDRKLQVLLGGSVEGPELPEEDIPEFTDEEYDRVENGWKYYHSREMYLNNLDLFWQKKALRRKVLKEYDEKCDQWNKYHGLKVISNDVYVYHRYDSGREYRYYYPSDNYTDETEENLAKYMLEDHKRYERLLDGDWCFLGYEVEVWVEDIEVANESVWGIESDMSRSDKEEVWGDLLDECFHDLKGKIEKEREALMNKWQDLTSSFNNIPDDVSDLVKEID